MPLTLETITGAPLLFCTNPAHPHVCPDTTALNRPADAAPWFCATCYRWVSFDDPRIPDASDREALTLHA